MIPADRFHNNFIALSSSQPDIATLVRSARRDDTLTSQTARDGSPSLTIAGNVPKRSLQIHSLYRPVEEARRVVDSTGDSATLVVFGMGAMFVPREYLKRHPSATVIAVEKDYAAFRAVLEEIDLTAPLETGRLYMTADEESLQRLLKTLHQPAIRDGLSIYELRSWTERPEHTSRFRYLRDVVTQTMREIAGEHGTIRRYGRPWFTHTVENTLRVNLPKAEEALYRTVAIIRSRPNRIIAAGPSLDTYFRGTSPMEGENAGDVNDIVVDTALPALTRRRRRYTGVVTLDPQGWSPLHFRTLRSPAPVIWGDWGITPSLPSFGEEFVPLGSAHPLHTLLATKGLPMLVVPGSRNVTETALRLVLQSGGVVSEIVGADYSYPRAITYARGTYHYTLAQMRANRLYPVETFFSDQVYPSASQNPAGIDSPGPVFERSGMAAQKARTAEILDTGTSPGSGVKSGGNMHIRTFWESHVEELNRLERAIVGHGDDATPLFLRLLGAHGRAHLPLLAAATDRVTPPDQRVVNLIADVRGFIFSRLSRY